MDGKVMRPSEPISQRLRDLQKLLPGQPEIVYRFAEHYAGKIASFPEVGLGVGWAMQLEIAHFTRSRSERDRIQAAVPEIIKACCDPEFAGRVLLFGAHLREQAFRRDTDPLSLLSHAVSKPRS
jgi:hypothetical protein